MGVMYDGSGRSIRVVSYAGKSRGNLGPLVSGPESCTQYPAPGKQTLVEQTVAPVVQQRITDHHDQRDETVVRAAAPRGVATSASPLPFSDTLQRAFGRHDVSSIQAHTSPEAAASAQAMGAVAYATGDHVVLGARGGSAYCRARGCACRPAARPHPAEGWHRRG